MQKVTSPDDQLSDTQLMTAVKAGDKQAFSQLYDRYAAHIYGVCLRILFHSTDAEVVVSDVFWEIWRKPDGFNPLRGSCRTYLFTLARSRAIDRLRATKTRQKNTLAAVSETAQILENQEPYAQLLTDERQQAVRVALKELHRDQREALLLAYFDGLTHGEISQQLGKPLGTVKTHIRRGLQTLKGVLKSLGGQDGLQ